MVQSEDRLFISGSVARQFMRQPQPSIETPIPVASVALDPNIFQRLVERIPSDQAYLLSSEEATYIVHNALESYRDGTMAFPLLNEPVLQEIVQSLRESEQRQRDLDLINATQAYNNASGLANLGAVWEKSAAEKRAKEPIVFDIADILKMQSTGSIATYAQIRFAPYVRSPEGGKPKRSAAQAIRADRVIIAAIPVGLSLLDEASSNDVYMTTNVATLLHMMPSDDLTEDEKFRISLFNQESLVSLSTVFRGQYAAGFMQYILDLRDAQGVFITDISTVLPPMYPDEILTESTASALQRMNAVAESMINYDATMEHHNARTLFGSLGRDYLQQMYGSVPYALQS